MFNLLFMSGLLISPLSFSPTKVGYKQYLKSGGAMQFASFQVFERRTKLQILEEKYDRLASASDNHIKMYEHYKKLGDSVSARMHLDSYGIRLNQETDVLLELKMLR